MKRLISTALVLSLLGGTSALAAPQDDHRGDRGGGQPRAAPAAPPAAARPQAVRPQARRRKPAPQRGPGWEHGGQNGRAQAQAVPQQQAPQRGPGQNGQNGQFRGQAVPQQGPQRGPGQNVQNGQFRGQAVPGARSQAIRPQDRANRDLNRPRFNPRQWQFQNRPSHRFHWRGPSYVLPYGFYPHSWAYGEILPFGWYTPNYYIDDWTYYGLEPPPYGYEWVREGNDALLVDVYTGAVVSVEYGLFF